MKCVIGSQSLGAWCRIIHTLAQVGDDEVYFDFAPTIMTLSTTNSSMSTFSTFILFKPFFASYSMTSEEPEKVAIPSKIILKPYRTQKMAKNHVTSEIQFVADSDHIIIKSEGKSHASSTYKLGASVNNQDIQFDCDPYTYPNYMVVDAKVLSNCLSNFSHMKGLQELALKIQGHRVTLRNTVTDVTRKDGSVATEFNLTSDDFNEFIVTVDDAEFVFGFREFKIFTTLAEQLKLSVEIRFQNPQDPVVIVVKSETFEARLCLATRIDDPFETVNRTPNTNGVPGSYGSDGRISNVTSQSSTTSLTSARGAPQERNRNVSTVSRGVATPSVNNPEPPPAKRVRRTQAVTPPARLSPAENFGADDMDGMQDVPLPSMDASRVGVSVFNLNEGEDQPQDDPPPEGSIGQLVEQTHQRTESLACKAIKNIISRPRRSDEEYLKTLPGHDIVLCPPSDDEEESG